MTIQEDVIRLQLENEQLKEENKMIRKELEKLEDKHALTLEENARYFKLIILLKKENRELSTWREEA